MKKKKREVKIIDEFKQFINKGDIFDLAIAIVLGSAFNAIVNTLANKILSPLISFFISGVSVDELVTELRPEEVNEAGEVVKAALTLDWGAFIAAIINFGITALLVFVIYKSIKLFRKGVSVIEVRTKEEAKRALEYFDGDPSTPAPRPKRKKRKKGEPDPEPEPVEEKKPEPTEEEKRTMTLNAILENLKSINKALGGETPAGESDGSGAEDAEEGSGEEIDGSGAEDPGEGAGAESGAASGGEA